MAERIQIRTTLRSHYDSSRVTVYVVVHEKDWTVHAGNDFCDIPYEKLTEKEQDKLQRLVDKHKPGLPPRLAAPEPRVRFLTELPDVPGDSTIRCIDQDTGERIDLVKAVIQLPQLTTAQYEFLIHWAHEHADLPEATVEEVAKAYFAARLEGDMQQAADDRAAAAGLQNPYRSFGGIKKPLS